MKLENIIIKTTIQILNEGDSPDMKVLDYILDIVNEFGEHKLTQQEREYYLSLKKGDKINRNLEKYIIDIINKKELSITNLMRKFEMECGDDFKEFNYNSKSLHVKTAVFLVTSLRQFFGVSEIKGVYSGLKFDPDMTISDIIVKLYNTKQSVWYENTEFLKILEDFLFRYLDGYLGILAINGFNLDKIK